MKEITPEVKQKIMALYYDVECFKYKTIPQHTYKVGTEAECYKIEQMGYLLLKPLSSISDEDAQCIYEIQEYVGKVGSLHFHTTGISLHASIKPLNNTSVNYEPVYSNAIDYLRSKGYALPAFGYSVDELVQACIFKLIEN